jgi:hypothetical protein
MHIEVQTKSNNTSILKQAHALKPGIKRKMPKNG